VRLRPFVSDVCSAARRPGILLLCLLAATLQLGCATKVRELMPTPVTFDRPAARAIFEPGTPQRPLVRRGRIAWEFPVNGARPKRNQAGEGFPR
jgi:hypothetical protein